MKSGLPHSCECLKCVDKVSNVYFLVVICVTVKCEMPETLYTPPLGSRNKTFSLNCSRFAKK